MENKDWREQFNEKFIQFENSIPVGGFEQAPYNRIKSFFESYLKSKQEEIEDEIEQMGKRKLLSPRSFGDNETTVDVSAGYNQALEDLKPIISKILK